MSHLPPAILFDLDETILSAYGRADLVWAEAVEELADYVPPEAFGEVALAIHGYGLRYWADELRAKEGRTRLREARREIVAGAFDELRQAGFELPADAATDALADHYSVLRDTKLSLFPGAEETLIRLRELGVRLGLITNGTAELQRAKIGRFALERHFDHIQIEGEHGFGKPEPQAYFHAMQSLGVGPADLWMVGDNLEWEVAAPQRLGIYAIWCDAYGVGLPPDSPIRPDRIIRGLPELLVPASELSRS